MIGIQQALDKLEEIENEMKNLINTLEVMGIGIKNDGNDSKDCEEACIHILSNYIEFVACKKIQELDIILESIK